MKLVARLTYIPQEHIASWVELSKTRATQLHAKQKTIEKVHHCFRPRSTKVSRSVRYQNISSTLSTSKFKTAS